MPDILISRKSKLEVRLLVLGISLSVLRDVAAVRTMHNMGCWIVVAVSVVPQMIVVDEKRDHPP